MGSRFTTPSRIANKNAAPSNDRRLSANVFGPPSPRRTIAVSTGEAYPKHRRVSKREVSHISGRSPRVDWLKEEEVLVSYTIHTIDDLLKAGDNFKFENVSPDLMTLRIKIHGEQFDSSISGDVAKSLGALQVALYRAAAEVLHGTSRITALSAEEKAQFEIVIKVSPGCSDIQIPGLKYILSLISKMTENMDSKHKCIVACFAICAFAGIVITPFITRAIENDQTVAGMADMARALTEPIKTAVEVAGDATAKSARDADSVDWGERHYSSEDIRKLNTRSPRQEAEADTFEATCQVTGFHRDGNIIKVDLKVVDGSEELTVKIPPPGLFDDAMPERPSEVAAIMEVGSCVAVTILVKETKSKTERVLVSWDVLAPQ